MESCSRWQGPYTEYHLRGSVTHPPPLFVKTRPSHSILWSRRAEGSRLIYGAQTELPGWDDSSTWTHPRGKPPASAWLVVARAWQLAIVLEWRQGSRRDPSLDESTAQIHPDHPFWAFYVVNKMNNAFVTFIRSRVQPNEHIAINKTTAGRAQTRGCAPERRACKRGICEEPSRNADLQVAFHRVARINVAPIFSHATPVVDPPARKRKK